MLGGIITARTKLLVSTRLSVSGLIFALAFLRISDLLAIWHIYTIVALLGTIQALNGPARMVIVPDLVERNYLMNAGALHSMVNQTGQIVGPAAAGGIIEMAEVGPALLVNAGLYLSGIALLLMIRGLAPQSATRKATGLEELQAGCNASDRLRSCIR